MRADVGWQHSGFHLEAGKTYRVRGKGRFRIDFLIYDLVGLKLAKMPNTMLETLRLPTRVVLPFLVLTTALQSIY